MASGPSYGVLGPAARMAMAAPATVIAPPRCVPDSVRARSRWHPQAHQCRQW
jgi:hypothetical protein